MQKWNILLTHETNDGLLDGKSYEEGLQNLKKLSEKKPLI